MARGVPELSGLPGIVMKEYDYYHEILDSCPKKDLRRFLKRAEKYYDMTFYYGSYMGTL